MLILRMCARAALLVLIVCIVVVGLARALGSTFTFLVVTFQELNDRTYFRYLDLTLGRVYTLPTVVPTSFLTYSTPNWSPDGRYIAGNGSGSPLIFDTYTRTLHIADERIDCGGWSPDSVHLACPTYTGSAYVLDARTLTVEPLFPDYRFTMFAWSPDGQQVAFAVSVGQTTEIYIGTLGNPTPRFLTTQGQDIRVLNWSPDGRYLMTYNTAYQIWTVYLVSTRTGRVYAFRSDFDHLFSDLRDIAWSPDGSRLAFRSITRTTQWTYDGPLYVLDLDTMQTQQIMKDGELPRWSPDSRRLLFNSSERRDTSSGGYTIVSRTFVANADGSGLRQIAERRGAVWLPDSQHLLLFDGDGVIYTMDVDDDASLRPIDDLNQQGGDFYVTDLAFWR